MKKTILTLCAMLLTLASVWAEGEVTGLKIEMKDAAKGYIQILFTDSPVVTHNPEAAQVIINANGTDAITLNMDDIKDMQFLDVENTATSIESLFPQKNNKSPKGIYTLSGQKVQKVQKGQVYIINGTKVLVK